MEAFHVVGVPLLLSSQRMRVPHVVEPRRWCQPTDRRGVASHRARRGSHCRRPEARLGPRSARCRPPPHPLREAVNEKGTKGLGVRGCVAESVFLLGVFLARGRWKGRSKVAQEGLQGGAPMHGTVTLKTRYLNDRFSVERTLDWYSVLARTLRVLEMKLYIYIGLFDPEGFLRRYYTCNHPSVALPLRRPICTRPPSESTAIKEAANNRVLNGLLCANELPYAIIGVLVFVLALC